MERFCEKKPRENQMKKYAKYFWSLIIFTTSLMGCQEKKTCEIEKNKGGIIFTFDDQYINEWHKFRNKFREYNIKATFFICRPQNLTSNQITKLNQLVSDGHEIGNHGLNHRNALIFKDSIDQYYSNEIKPGLDNLESLGFEIKSFAYPYGNSTEPIDSFLLDSIPYLRKATWNKKDTSIDYYNDIFANEGSYRVINSMGIDYNYHISLESLEKGIQRAKKENEVLILHAHRIDTVKKEFVVNPVYLESIFRLSNKHGLKSIRICDLKRHFEDSS